MGVQFVLLFCYEMFNLRMLLVHYRHLEEATFENYFRWQNIRNDKRIKTAANGSKDKD